MTGRAELITWCRIFAINAPCAKPCDDCRRTSAINAKLPAELRASLANNQTEKSQP